MSELSQIQLVPPIYNRLATCEFVVAKLNFIHAYVNIVVYYVQLPVPVPLW